MAWYEYPPYVSAAERRQRVASEIARRKKKGLTVEPVIVEGRAIARSFWGKAWCLHLESYSDYVNRLPRGRTYVRSGAVLHLGVAAGRVEALVQGSDLYQVTVTVTPLTRTRWKGIVSVCSGKIDSVVELLRGRLSDGVMREVVDRERGLFPAPAQIRMDCSCPDSALMCKHIAAVLYAVGARLDERPELLFVLRKVDHLELLSVGAGALGSASGDEAPAIAADDLGGIFGIEIDTEVQGGPRRPKLRGRGRESAKPVVEVAPAARKPRKKGSS